MKRKAQASLEYLTTYGWAFILIIIIIGAMAFFGILNPKKLLPDRCSFPADFQCNDFILISAGDIKLQLKNNVGNSIILTGVEPKTEAGALTCGSITASSQGTDLGDPVSSGVVWPSGNNWDITLFGCDFLNVGILAGNKEKISLKINYYHAKSSPTYQHIVEGEVVGTVQ